MKTKCYCGSNKDFSDCCQQYLVNKTKPKCAEQLMRSRFSAYATNNAQYIYDTYANNSKASQSVDDIKEWSKACVWLALQVHSFEENSLNNEANIEQFVEFSAFYVNENKLCVLREKSRFIQEVQCNDNKDTLHWRYIDGDIITHHELTSIKRKDICPCNQFPTAWSIKKGKKFKQCCGK